MGGERQCTSTGLASSQHRIFIYACSVRSGVVDALPKATCSHVWDSLVHHCSTSADSVKRFTLNFNWPGGGGG